MGRLLVIPVGLLLLLSLAMVWSGVAAQHEPPPNFTFINRGEIGTLDPKAMSWLQDIRTAYALWEGLYTLAPETLEAVPGCAFETKPTDGGTVCGIL